MEAVDAVDVDAVDAVDVDDRDDWEAREAREEREAVIESRGSRRRVRLPRCISWTRPRDLRSETRKGSAMGSFVSEVCARTSRSSISLYFERLMMAKTLEIDFA